MIVMKFGGTSIADKEAIERVVNIIQTHQHQHPVVVNSAMGKTTRNLLHIAQWSAAGDAKKAQNKLDEIKEYHLETATSVISGFMQSEAHQKIDAFFKELDLLLNGVSVLQDYTPKIQDKFLAYGELISTTIITAALQSNNLPAIWTDAREYVITDDRFTQANVIEEETYHRIEKRFSPFISEGKIPVAQGFIGSTINGATTTLGFEGSDFSAALIGAALKCDDIQLWKDVPGIMTADPAVIQNASTVKQLSFDEAATLTYFGAKIIHPSSIAPAQKADIPVHVRNSRNPKASGTEITSVTRSCKNAIKSIAYKKDIALLLLQSNGHLKSVDLVKWIYNLIDREQFSPCLTNISENQMVIAIEREKISEHLLNDLKIQCNYTLLDNRTIVTLVGDTIRNNNTFARESMQSLREIPVDMVSYGASKINIHFVLEAIWMKQAISQLHDHFFKRLDIDIFEK